MNKVFTKSDLKTGMIVTTRKHGEAMVMLNTSHRDRLVWGNELGFESISNYKDNLTNVNSKNFDIMTVYEADISNTLRSINNASLRTLVWERQEESPNQKELRLIEEQMKELAEKAKALREKL